MRAVPAESWHDAWSSAAEQGARWLDFLSGVDRIEYLEVVGHALAADGSSSQLISTRVAADDPTLRSISDVFAGAVWYEREIAEMFGVRFDGLADDRPLLLRTEHGAPPLLRSTVLAARVVKPWPGNQPGKRPQRAPGTPDSWGEAT